MNKMVLVMGIAGWLLLGGLRTQTAYADDPVVEPAVASAEPAVMNHPTTGWELTKSLVGYVEPGADWLVTFTDGSAQTGFSGALYTFTSKGFPIASVRAGYGLTDPITYGSLALDLPGLAGRLIPASVKGLSPGSLNAALAFASKFVRIGPVAGYDWNLKKPVFGVGVGAALTTTF